ncbi:hypothetical protein ACET3X_004992 [Alternaria dauci]|uniref:Glycosyltransferase family 2 protein n=1 Tax=Alternaria dauci TaxID=48095 RepID=A0ABR3UJL7_9PLEO
MSSPSKNMRKLAFIFGSISIGWIWWLHSLYTKTIPTRYPTWWYFFTISSLGGWATFIIYYTMVNSNREKTPGPKPHKLWNLLHIVPMALLNATVTRSLSVQDKGLLWFSTLMVYRYYRTVLTLYFYSRYEMASNDSPQGQKFKPSDCTVIVPTVGPMDNPVFDDMVEMILRNMPARLIFSANSMLAKTDVEKRVKKLIGELKEKNELKTIPDVEYTYVDDSNKRRQTCHAVENVKTRIIVMADDTAIWNPQFLNATLPAFNDPDVGLVGTRKVVRYTRPDRDPGMSLIQYCKKWYWAGFWNTIGALYLQRHNFETQASNTADGGVFAVSGRTLLVLTSIIKDDHFKDQFLNEHVLRAVFTWLTRLTKWHIPFAGQVLAYFKGKGLNQNGFGPILADDDNFITRWTINHGYNIKIQSSPNATITTVLGNVKTFKFVKQCNRWSRTTFRQNPIALFKDRTIWWKWPISVWTVYFPWMYNFAVVWDSLAIFAFCRSGLYLECTNGNMRLILLVSFIWLNKLAKTAPWFSDHPYDFLLYFCPIPAYPMFGYFHSYLKAITALTCWNNDWSGRDVGQSKDRAGIISGNKKAEDAAQVIARLKEE